MDFTSFCGYLQVVFYSLLLSSSHYGYWEALKRKRWTENFDCGAEMENFSNIFSFFFNATNSISWAAFTSLQEHSPLLALRLISDFIHINECSSLIEHYKRVSFSANMRVWDDMCEREN